MSRTGKMARMVSIQDVISMCLEELREKEMAINMPLSEVIGINRSRSPYEQRASARFAKHNEYCATLE